MRPLETHAIHLPADAGWPNRAGVEWQAEIVLRVEAMAGCHALQDFGTVLGAEAEGTQSGLVAAVSPDQAQDAEVLFIDKLWRRDQCAVHLPPFFSVFRILALADFDTELAFVGCPFQDIEQLLPGAGRAGFFLGDGHRDTAQVFEPGQCAATGRFFRIALFDGLEQHRRNVLAMFADGTGAAADDGHLAALGLAQISLCHVGFSAGAGDEGAHLATLYGQVLHQVNVRPRFVDVAGGEPVGDVLFGEGGEVDDGHRWSGKQRADEQGEKQGNDSQPAVLLFLDGDQAIDLWLQVDLAGWASA